MPVIESLRQRAATKVVSAINTCRNTDQCLTTRRLIAQFQKMHDPEKQLPFDRWILEKECELVHPNQWSIWNKQA